MHLLVRISREIYVRLREGVGVQFPCATRPDKDCHHLEYLPPPLINRPLERYTSFGWITPKVACPCQAAGAALVLYGTLLARGHTAKIRYKLCKSGDYHADLLDKIWKCRSYPADLTLNYWLCGRVI